MKDLADRPGAWAYLTRVGVSAGGITIVVGDVVPLDSFDVVEACDAVHNGAVATDIAIGLLRGTEAVLFVSSATAAARPVAGAPLCIERKVIVPPGWQFLAAASNLAVGETVTLRALTRRVLL